MQYRRLGGTGLLVSRLSLGAMTFGEGAGFGKMSRDDVRAMIDRAIDAGINFIDTADVYVGGQSERLLGEILGERRRHLVLATKVNGRTGPALNDAGLSRLHVLAACDASLARLQTDYIDLYIVHREDPLTPIEETLEALNDLVRAGKVRYVGFSNWSAWKAAIAVQTQAARGWARFCSGQMYYSLLGRELEYDVIPFMQYAGVGLTVWSPLCGGILSGKYSRENIDDRATAAPDTRLGAAPFMPYRRDTAHAVLEALRTIGARHGATVAQAAIAWVLARPAVDSVIIGASRMSQLEDNLGALGVELGAAEIAELDRITRPASVYPQWFNARNDDPRYKLTGGPR
ncbi:MAG: aldo/keto reductase [Gammaproteobacteria bacterium]